MASVVAKTASAESADTVSASFTISNEDQIRYIAGSLHLSQTDSQTSPENYSAAAEESTIS